MAESQNPISLQHDLILMDNYQLLEVINQGSYGVVYRARDKRNNQIVAVKEELQGMSRTTAMEIRILKTLPHHPNIIEFKEVVSTASGSSVFLVMEHMDYDLVSLRDHWRNPFDLTEIKHILEGVLKGVSFLHDHGIMHRDIKPSNILFTVKNGGRIKICDFGFSAPYRTSKACSYSPHVGTRWYKAPELLHGSQRYSCGVNMWAVGCIMAELVLDQVLFPGESEAVQLYCIHELINPPLNRLRVKMEAVATCQGTAVLTASVVDLLQRLLAYEPENRITARDALNHPWFRE